MSCLLSSTIITWRNCNSEEQHWDQRQARLHTIVDRATQSTRAVIQQIGRESPNSLLLQQGKPTVISTLSLLADLAGLVRDETTPSKAALFSVIGPWVEPTLVLLSYYCTHDHGMSIFIFNYLN